MCTSALTLPKMSIDTLIAAAEYIEDSERKRQQPPPPQPQQQQAVQPAVVLHQAIPIQHVTIQPPNGHIIAAAANAIHIQRKKDGASVGRVTVMNSFDLINPPTIDHGSGELKRKQPPMAFRTGTREVHNKLEKNRRAHLKDCFEDLFNELPNARDAAAKKTSNLNILDSALKYIRELKRDAAASEGLIEQLAKQKIGLNQRCATLRKEIKSLHDIDVPDVPEDGGRKRTKSQTASPTEKLDHRVALVEATPLAAGTTTTAPTPPPTPAPSGGGAPKLPKSINAAAPKDVNGGGGAFTFAGYPLPATSGGGLVLVPQAGGGGGGAHHHHHHQHQLTAQFVAARHPAADGKVIVNAKYLVKPLVVVSTPSRPS